MMEERYHATAQNRFYPDMYNVNKNITVEAKLISPSTYYLLKLTLLFRVYCYICYYQLQPSLKMIGRIKVCPLMITIFIITTFHFWRF